MSALGGLEISSLEVAGGYDDDSEEESEIILPRALSTILNQKGLKLKSFRCGVYLEFEDDMFSFGGENFADLRELILPPHMGLPEQYCGLNKLETLEIWLGADDEDDMSYRMHSMSLTQHYLPRLKSLTLHGEVLEDLRIPMAARDVFGFAVRRWPFSLRRCRREGSNCVFFF